MPKSETPEQHAHRIFKCLKVGLKKDDDLTNEELILLYKFYPFIFTDYQKFLMERWLKQNDL